MTGLGRNWIVAVALAASGAASAQTWSLDDMMRAAQSGGVERVKAALASQPSYANAKDGLGRTALHKAATKDIVEVLVAAGSDVDAKAGFGQTPLWEAVSDGRAGAAGALIVAHADVNAAASDRSTPLHRAATFNEADIAQKLIAARADLERKDDSGRTPLARACDMCRKLMVTLLAQAGADVTVKDGEGRSPRDLAEHCSKADGRDAIFAILDSRASAASH